GVYFYPLDQEARHAMYDTFMAFADTRTMQNTPLMIWGRAIETRCYTHDLAWFNCDVLCSIPRSTQDYLELARQFQSIFISDVPIFKAIPEHEDLARNFINMIDIFYDHHIKLILSADAPIMNLYQGEKLTFDFARTQSRLIEMQSKEYLAREHRP
ncbi:MAG: cell division protein ZapE, partial [Gammaproteobacteria bacterium]|nr:cell division protein ZapE [Gammaproteobacteria bacterium]